MSYRQATMLTLFRGRAIYTSIIRRNKNRFQYAHGLQMQLLQLLIDWKHHIYEPVHEDTKLG